MPGGPYMLKALIILTLAAGALSLLLWLGAERRPAAHRARRAPAVSGRIVGRITPMRHQTTRCDTQPARPQRLLH